MCPTKEAVQLKKNHAHSTSLSLVGKVFVVDSAGDRNSTVIVQVVVQLTVTSTEFQMFKEQRIVLKGESVEDVKASLHKCYVSCD
jgi:hypothetical protein